MHCLKKHHVIQTRNQEGATTGSTPCPASMCCSHTPYKHSCSHGASNNRTSPFLSHSARCLAPTLLHFQVLMFSATLHSPEVKRLAAAICQQPLLVDLKGKDAVPDTVDHVLVRVDPTADATWLQSTPKVGRRGTNPA